MSSKGWVREQGSYLQEAIEGHFLAEVLDEVSAIYMWKKNLENKKLLNNSQAIEWVDEIISTPHGLIQNKHIGPFLYVSEIEVKSEPMSDDKRNTLYNWSTNHRNRQWLSQYISTLSQHAPALYVGETGNILERTKNHMNAQTDFGKGITQYLDWSEVDLYYYRMGKRGEEGSPLRKSIEYITNSLTIGGFTKRPG